MNTWDHFQRPVAPLYPDLPAHLATTVRVKCWILTPTEQTTYPLLKVKYASTTRIMAYFGRTDDKIGVSSVSKNGFIRGGLRWIDPKRAEVLSMQELPPELGRHVDNAS